MMRFVLIFTMLALLSGCVRQSSPMVVSSKQPSGVIKLLGDKELTTYVDMRVISAYQGNTNLRQFYMINNYAEITHIGKNPILNISSSSAINVVNCETQQRAQFSRTYYSLPYAQGDVIITRSDVGQWSSINKDSLLGIIANAICLIAPDRLKPEPAKETRKPLLVM